MKRAIKEGEKVLWKSNGSNRVVIFDGYVGAKESKVEDMMGTIFYVPTDQLELIEEKPEKPLVTGTEIDHPDYYNRYSVEVVEMARRIWGDEALKTAAEITAFIYRMRAGTKPDNPVEKDLNKEQWWLDYKNNKLK